MVTSIGHFDSDKETFVIDRKLHNGAPISKDSEDSEDGPQSSPVPKPDPLMIGREFHRLTEHSQVGRQVIDRPALHPRDEYSLMMKMKTPYQMATILPPADEYETLKTIAADAETVTLPSKKHLESELTSLRRYSGPSDEQPLSFTIVYETGHIAIHTRENCVYDGQYLFAIDSDVVSDLFNRVYSSGFGDLKHTYLDTRDSLEATSIGLCVGTDQQWVYAYTDTPPRSFELLEQAILRCAGTDLFETGDQTAITDRLYSDAVAPALALLVENPELTGALPTDALWAGIRTGLRSEQELTTDAALEVLSAIDEPIPDNIWTAVSEVQSTHPEILEKLASLLLVAPFEGEDVAEHVFSLLLKTLTEDANRDRTAALNGLDLLGSEHPQLILDALPVLETMLRDGSTSEQRATLDVVLTLAQTDPEYVTPLSDILLEFVEQRSHPIPSSAAIGYLAKARPDVAVAAIPTFADWTTQEDPQIRSNGLGVLADLAETYPEKVLPYADRAHELLDDDDTYARYNATSVLARIVRVAPGVVDPAAERLQELLTTDHAPTQRNVCWALGRLGRQEALPTLRVLQNSAEEESVQAAAIGAEALLTTTECPHCKATPEPHSVSVAVVSDPALTAWWTCPKCDQSIRVN
ncbi:HEAT repeat domain-containing protein [Halobellus inordinatus]|uniref:HEAT repeat domain-containing protein n=1 Tax=Halobellus inordinatus TaxID=1126236 RepID=UPI002114BF37|nr:HEAT repeat domain-containing protein [Halobellus ramosii]